LGLAAFFVHVGPIKKLGNKGLVCVYAVGQDRPVGDLKEVGELVDQGGQVVSPSESSVDSRLGGCRDLLVLL